jgi:hypothetical protein
MVGRKTPLNATQLAVLTWVGDGTAPGIYEGWSHRLVARALHNRGLVLVKGHGPSWTASITEDGAYYLEHGTYPPRDRRHNGSHSRGDLRRGPEIATPTTQRSRARTSVRTPATPARRPPVKKRGPVDQFALSLQDAADHRILVPINEGARYRYLAGFAKRLGRIPEGMRLSFDYTRQDGSQMLAVALERPPEWQTRVLNPSRASKKAQETSDVVQALMDSESSLCVESHAIERFV